MSSSSLRPFFVRLFSEIFVETSDLFVHAMNAKEACAIAIAAQQEDSEENGEWIAIQVLCTENM